ncbi:hypothetical protein AC579_3253 [Pseudocercospora musae]|uniref:Uncharacterized protein n=1 Tax=Pseudocercospora musae TaxID=113226 RepID=A0A139HZK3_9PEZI|nr:hypothetical protein AC579_3253 [Pseudocercospora musae]
MPIQDGDMTGTVIPGLFRSQKILDAQSTVMPSPPSSISTQVMSSNNASEYHGTIASSPATPTNSIIATPELPSPYASAKGDGNTIGQDPEYVDLESRPVTATVERIFTPSALLELPEEIRVRIYRYAVFPNGTANAPRPHFSPSSCWRIKPPALLGTCYDIRQEAIKMYYSQFSITARSTRALIPFLRSLNAEARAALGKVLLKYDWYDQERQSINQQVNKALATFKMAGVELQRTAIEITGVVVTE